MQRERSVKVKEVIESLCKLLCALGVDSVPGAETFRRAKFNKADAVADMWRLLYSVLVKALRWECSCPPPARKPDQGWPNAAIDAARARMARTMLFQCGYGAPWLLGVGGRHDVDAVGSRDLLLALGWLLSSGSLLENLLREAARGPEALPDTTAVTASFRVPGAGGSLVDRQRAEEELGEADWEEGLKALLWQHGKLTFLRRSLQAAQEEKARLLHQVLFLARCPTNSQGCSAKSLITSASENKELERLKAEAHVLEKFLEWKDLEGLFWCWMGSVIDAKLADPLRPLPEKAVAPESGDIPFAGGCRQAQVGWRAVYQLGESLQALQAGLRTVRAGPVGNALSWMKRSCDGKDQLVEQADIQKRVQARLCSLKETYTLSASVTRYRPCLLECPNPQRHNPASHVPCEVGQRHGVRAAQLIRELREKEAVLRSELGRLRQGAREELLERAGRLKGTVLIPPVKR
ncbi:tubulin epsilon and delta complex protein 1 isoform X1 [Scleropages formosus]|uniref:tubulin epsilon and delta complex protein 1 isoform X1 n=1 Tax=Scleropages formosus TaxID=113540 RepID=UPI0010FA8046|nr:tubulin epsilon and delta complex protein 1 isoform X1 [Scleropages formosus]